MTLPILAPAPLRTALEQPGGTPSPTWANWLQQLQQIVAALNPQTAASYYASANQSLPNSANVRINFDTKLFDTDSAVTTGASWQFKVPTGRGGLYQISAAVLTTITGTPGAGSGLATQIWLNGVQTIQFGQVALSTTTIGNPGSTGSALLKLNDGDAVDIRLFQNTGITQNTAAGQSFTWCTIARLAGT